MFYVRNIVFLLLYARHQKFNFHPSPYSWPLWSISPFPAPSPLVTMTVFCVCMLGFGWLVHLFCCLFLVFFIWVKSCGICFSVSDLISLSLIPSRSIYIVIHGRISSFHGWIVFPYVCVIYVFHMYIYMCVCIHTHTHPTSWSTHPLIGT